ncbi:MAG: YqjK family protein [Betaproteobacteria bacterium]|nr:YqjK family protein [Betaproteobacteria bacterium]
MRERLIALRERRARLLARASAEREALAGLLNRADSATAWLGKVARLLAEARLRPVWIAAAVAVLVGLRPKRTLKWLASGWTLWQAYRGARLWLRRLAPVIAASLAPRREG